LIHSHALVKLQIWVSSYCLCQ